jgi:hypothetical protein
MSSDRNCRSAIHYTTATAPFKADLARKRKEFGANFWSRLTGLHATGDSAVGGGGCTLVEFDCNQNKWSTYLCLFTPRLSLCLSDCPFNASDHGCHTSPYFSDNVHLILHLILHSHKSKSLLQTTSATVEHKLNLTTLPSCLPRINLDVGHINLAA